MGSSAELYDLLESLLPPTDTSANSNSRKPFVLLTYAQSLDGMIGLQGGGQLRLSGDESMRMTHWLRSRCQAILVGSGTVLADDPSLTCRIPTLLPKEQQPQPFVVASRSSLPLVLAVAGTRKLFHPVRTGGHAPIVVAPATSNPQEEEVQAAQEGKEWTVRRAAGEADRPSWEATFKHVTQDSVMVEGGASIITSLLAEPALWGDLLVVTIAPVFVGSRGVPVFKREGNGLKLDTLGVFRLGQDTVLVARSS